MALLAEGGEGGGGGATKKGLDFFFSCSLGSAVESGLKETHAHSPSVETGSYYLPPPTYQLT
jgi:hypothetical protein